MESATQSHDLQFTCVMPDIAIEPAVLRQRRLKRQAVAVVPAIALLEVGEVAIGQSVTLQLATDVAQNLRGRVRIDMAKHIGLSELSSIIQELRDRVRVNASGPGASSEQPFFLLEYWSTRYRDLRFGSEALDTQSGRCHWLTKQVWSSCTSADSTRRGS